MTYLQITFFLSVTLLIIAQCVSKLFFDFNLILDNGFIKPHEKGNKYTKIPIFLSPFYIFVVVYFKINRNKLNDRYELLDSLSAKVKRKYNVFFWSYIVLIFAGIAISTLI